MTTSRTSAPDPVVTILGFAGLLPQIAALLALLVLGPRWHGAAVIVAFAYAALILSFLGGMWWASPREPNSEPRAGSGSRP
jgi:NhaP-type Na+/H+ or K+/H+ antiporter